MRALRLSAAAFAVLLTAGTLLAQGDGPGAGFRGGRGFGDRNSMAGLLRQDDVQKVLGITSEQDTKIREATEAAFKSVQPPDIDYQGLRDASAEDRQAAWAKMREFGQSVDKEFRTKLAGILDETQMKRVRGLWAQRAGDLAALNNEEIAAELKLDDAQKATLKTQLDEERPQMRGFGFGGRRPGEGNPPADGASPPQGAGAPPAEGAGSPPAAGEGGGEGRERFQDRRREARRASDEKALAVLTEEQKTAYVAIKGEPFEFAEPQFRAFGGGGRRGGDGDSSDRPRTRPPAE
jgi:hypothetical protein